MRAADYIDLQRYPVHRPWSAAWRVHNHLIVSPTLHEGHTNSDADLDAGYLHFLFLLLGGRLASGFDGCAVGRPLDPTQCTKRVYSTVSVRIASGKIAYRA